MKKLGKKQLKSLKVGDMVKSDIIESQRHVIRRVLGIRVDANSKSGFKVDLDGGNSCTVRVSVGKAITGVDAGWISELVEKDAVGKGNIVAGQVTATWEWDDARNTKVAVPVARTCEHVDGSSCCVISDDMALTKDEKETLLEWVKRLETDTPLSRLLVKSGKVFGVIK